MMEERRNYSNFCNNIRRYHGKKHQQQFYDFTIKDKNGVEFKSHKFILASQCSYFAGLFRIHPNSSETTFADFSLDEIKMCIEYLYTYKVKLTGKNVQNVLLFADYINLTDVREICINYIIKHIDRSNCAHVIELGYSLGIEEFVEAGNEFAKKNLIKPIRDLDEDTIVKAACMQQERVTIMTRKQWYLNLMKQWLTAPHDVSGFHARGSSVFNNDLDKWAPKFAIDGKVSECDIFYFHSQLEMHPWLEVKFPSPVLISSVTIFNRKNSCWARLRNVEVRAGMMPVPDGFTAYDRGNHSNKRIDINSQCGFFAGPPKSFICTGHGIKFEKPTLAQYITLQILGEGVLQINGLKINGGDLLNYECAF